MDPNAQHSENVGPPWTPPVWAGGYKKLVVDAKNDMFSNHHHLQTSVLDGSSRAMAGSNAGEQNESDQLIPSNDVSSRAENWNQTLQDLYRDEPLAAWATGAYDGDGQANPANPAP